VKILLACQQSPHLYPLPAYGFWRTYFVHGLREAGHEVVEVPQADWARGLLPLPATELARWRGDTWTRTLDCARDTAGLDLFLGYLYPQQIEVSAVKALRVRGLPAVNFFCDNVREYRRLPAEFSSFDLNWVPEFEALPLYAGRGWKALFAPMPCWVPPDRRRVPDAETGDLCFIGRADSLRRDLLRQVAKAGLPLALAGAGWAPVDAEASVPPRPTWRARIEDWADYCRRQGVLRTGRRLLRPRPPPTDSVFDFSPWLRSAPDDEEYTRLLAESAVSIGINRYPDPSAARPAVYSRLRDIEAPMLGACHLTEWAPELPYLFDIEREIAVYHDAEELISQARSLLTDAPRRRRLREAGARRAHADHSVGRTIARVAQALGLSA